MQNKPVIIGISGKIGSGKDTLADLLIKKDSAFVKKSFAYKLKQIGAFLTGTEIELWTTQEGKNVNLLEWGMTVGEFQQKLGTEAMRLGLHPQTWILSLFADWREGDKWIITDMRFVNEANKVTEVGGTLVRLNGDPAKVRENSKRDLTHPSETDLDNYEFDLVYENTKSIEELDKFADLVLHTATKE